MSKSRKTKPAQKLEPLLLTAAELSEALGLSVQKLTALATARRVPKAGPNCYDATQAVPAYLQYMETSEEAPARKRVRDEIEKARLELLKGQVQAIRQKLDKLNEMFIPRSEVEAALAPIFAQWRADSKRLYEQNFPAWAAKQFEAKAIKARCEQNNDELYARARNGCESEPKASK